MFPKRMVPEKPHRPNRFKEVQEADLDLDSDSSVSLSDLDSDKDF
jgi:hypothetical protein